MSNISENLKYLRKKKNLTQQQFADAVGIKRSLVGAYEEDRAEPKYSLLNKIAEFFELSMDEFVNERITASWKPKPKSSASNLRILSITVDSTDNENMELIPQKASAGYLNGYADPEYIRDLPKFRLPIPSLNKGTYRVFEIKGDSMLPVESGSYIVGEYVEDWRNIRQNETYIILSRHEGVVYKRVGNQFRDGKPLLLVSDNTIYEPYEILPADILEVWKAKAYVSLSIPAPKQEKSLDALTELMSQMQQSIAKLKHN